jgi:hypothetical protein
MGKIERFVNGFGEISRIASTASVCILAKIRVMSFRMACRIASTSGVATLEDFLSLGYPKPLVFQAKRKVEMEEKETQHPHRPRRHLPCPCFNVAGVAADYGTP